MVKARSVTKGSISIISTPSLSEAMPLMRRTRSRTSMAAIPQVSSDIDHSEPGKCRTSDTFTSRGSSGTSIPPTTRTSRSSVSTIHDSEDASGYSTPMTSAMATPKTVFREELVSVTVPLGKPAYSDVKIESIGLEKSVNAKGKMRAVEPVVLHCKKRKLAAYKNDCEDSDDNTPDAQLARALQEQEDRDAVAFADESDSKSTPRRTKRMYRPAKVQTGYVSDYDSDFEDVKRDRKGKGKLLPSKTKDVVVADSDGDSDFDVPSDVDMDSDSKTGVAGPSKGKAFHPLEAKTKAAIKAALSDIAQSLPGSSRKGKRVMTTSKLSTLVKQAPDDSTDLSELDEAELDARLAADSEEEAMYISTDDDDGDLSEVPSEDLDSHDARSRAASHRRNRHIPGEDRFDRRARKDRERLEFHHPDLLTMWDTLRDLPAINVVKGEQPDNINRQLKPFQLEGVAWMREMEKTEWAGGLLGDEMGMGKTIQAVSLIMSDFPAKLPSLVLIPPVALMQWQQEIADYTDGTLKTFVYHGTNAKSKNMTIKELSKYNVILMSYNSLESMYRHQEKGRRRKEDGVDKMHFQKSVIHQIKFHRVILDEAHNIKQRTTGVAKACFALKADHKWCLSGTPLQNRIGEFFSLVRFLNIKPFSCYMCKQCPCSSMEWAMNENNRCTGCNHGGMQHVSVFNQELLNPIQKHGNKSLGKVAFGKLRMLTDRFMLRRVKRDHSSSMELPAKEIIVDRQFFGEVENDFAGSIMNNSARQFDTYVAAGVMLNNYANIFGLIMQMRQVADHPDLILKKDTAGGQNVLNCCICDETAEDAIRSTCKHDFCRQCVKTYMQSMEESGAVTDCPRCHIPLSIDLEQPEMEQDEQNVKKSSIINRIKMENWTSSSKIEALVYDLHSLRSSKSSSKSIIFSQFTTMLQLVEWRLRRAGITTVMLDGSMTPAQRQASINTFMTDVNVECFLVSLKAGGVALNLTEASKVFLIDPWWNPAAEWQSADRCHRIGQSRPCVITRLCIEDSVESRMVLLQEKKANMINSTINADETAMESLTPEDMQFLFRGT